MTKIEGFRDRLLEFRSNWLEAHPDYSVKEATAAVALNAARYAINDMTLNGKFNEASEILMSGELPRRGKLIESTTAYEKYGTWFKSEVERLRKDPGLFEE